ncbi:hypothetical protein [Comamonas sp. C11]|nr:hypothetical protein [Comamonas sp. C11]UUC92274.1 hypothetical protein NOX35_18570 [Comamonas sp. C11]
MSTVISGYGRRRPAAMFSLLKSSDADEANLPHIHLLQQACSAML